jgi:hypothetical protein
VSEQRTTYAALREAMNTAVDAMIRADNMWSINSIPRLKRAWLAAVDVLETEARQVAAAEVARASLELSGRANEK